MAGRPAHVYSEIIAARIESLLKFGITQPRIAIHVGLSDKTVRKYYAEVLEASYECQTEAVEASLFYQATVMNIPSLTIFYLKTRMPHKYAEKIVENRLTKEDLFAALAQKLPD